MFFSPRNKKTALGMYSPTYFVTLAVCLALVVVALVFSRKMRKETVRWVIIGVGIFLWITEFGKMLFVGLVYGVDEVEFVPLYFCSMFMYASMLTCFKSRRLQTTANAFMFFGGIIGATAFFAYPSAVIPNYPLFHYMTLRTFVYHSLMIYVGFLIVITGYYKPELKHFREYAIFLAIVFVLAYTLNKLQGTNLMYISKPLGIELMKTIYNAMPEVYPFLFAVCELVLPFFLSYGAYKLVTYIIYRIKNTKEKKLCSR